MPQIATGFEFQALTTGDVRIEFRADDGTTINAQIVSQDAFVRMPLAAFVVATGLDRGAEVAAKLVRIMREAEEAD